MSEENSSSAGNELENAQHSEHSSEHHSHHSGHRHHKKKFKIPKNALIIAAAAIVLVGMFVLLIRYIDGLNAEEQAQIYTGDVVTDAPDVEESAEQADAENRNVSADKIDAKAAAENKNVPKESTQWCVLGDSIACGYYSEAEADGGAKMLSGDRENVGWAYLVEKEKSWNLTNLATPGEGYLIPASESGTCGYQQARTTDFSSYNLVTIALGISDWIADCPMGSLEDDPTTETITAFIPAMRATIEAIASSNPMCKIIVILPLNTNGYEHAYGTQADNWGTGYEMSNSGTLKQFSETMIAVCELYGIQYIDLTMQSCINSISLPTMLPDGVHPSAETHRLLAGELAEKITFR